MDRRPNIIAIVGPESTGKTTLAHQLADRLNGQLVHEFAREYLTGLGRPYVESDLAVIAQGQFDLERQALASGHPTIICDTDQTVLHVWGHVRFGRAMDPIPRLLALQAPRIHLLMAPDLEWEADPLRENPMDRDRLFDRYAELLAQMGGRYVIVRGTGPQRLANALSALKELEGVLRT